MSLADYEFSYRGLSFGTGHPVHVQAFGGLGLGQVRAPLTPRPFAGGAFRAGAFPPARSITLDLYLTEPDPAAREALLDAVRLAFGPVQQDEELRFKLPGRAEQAVLCQTLRRSLNVDVAYDHGYVPIVVELASADGELLSAAVKTGSCGLPTGAGGLTFDVIAPISFGGGLIGGSITVVNSGTWDAGWRAELVGPLTDPVIRHPSSGREVRLVGVVEAGRVLIVTTEGGRRQVLLDGYADRFGWVTQPTDWFTLPPGSSIVELRAAAGSGSLHLSWRDTWM